VTATAENPRPGIFYYILAKLDPLRVEKLAARFVESFVGMRTKIVALRLSRLAGRRAVR
jgi:hypothetical protein